MPEPEEKLTPTEMTHLLLGLICERLRITAVDIAFAGQEVREMKRKEKESDHE